MPGQLSNLAGHNVPKRTGGAVQYKGPDSHSEYHPQNKQQIKIKDNIKGLLSPNEESGKGQLPKEETLRQYNLASSTTHLLPSP